MKPSILKPCPEDWDNMHETEIGRYCDSCCKVVVDFTSKPNDEVIAYLRENSGQRVCGRFRAEQVETPDASFSFSLVRFVAAAFLVFGSLLFAGCQGNTDHQAIKKTANEKHPMIVGALAPEPLDSPVHGKLHPVPDKKANCVIDTASPRMLQGEVAAPVIMGDTILPH